MAHIRSSHRRFSPRRLFSSLAAPVALAAASAALLVGSGGALAQTTGVTIKSLNCDGSPETVELSNTGTQAVNLTGWTLQSDPSTESFDLTPAGTISPGSSVFISSGPGASGAFIWSTSEVFRNGDSSDYARLVEANGVTVATVNCAAATPAANGVPNGGGPPGTDSAATVGLFAAAAGGALVALTMLVGLIWMGVGLVTRRGSRGDGDEPALEAGETNPESLRVETGSHDASESIPQAKPISQPVSESEKPSRPAADVNLWPFLLVIVGALLAALVLMLAVSGGSRRK